VTFDATRGSFRRRGVMEFAVFVEELVKASRAMKNQEVVPKRAFWQPWLDEGKRREASTGTNSPTLA
jgi:hypothetical protein